MASKGGVHALSVSWAAELAKLRPLQEEAKSHEGRKRLSARLERHHPTMPWLLPRTIARVPPPASLRAAPR